MMKLRSVARRLVAGVASAVLMLAAVSASAQSRSDQKLNALFAEAARSPALLRLLLQSFPKGADLHRHGEGAIYAEDFLSWAAAKDGCLVVQKMVLARGPCEAPASVPVRGLESRDIKLYNDAVDALSMGRHEVSVGDPAVSGHERFFATFDRFGFAARGERARLIAANREQAAYDNTLYIELMAGPDISRDMRPLYSAEPWNEADMAGRLERLRPVLAEVVPAASAGMDAIEKQANELNGCTVSTGQSRASLTSGESRALSKNPLSRPAIEGLLPQATGPLQAVATACDVTVRYLMTGLREGPPEQVFGRLALGFAMVDADPRFVGVNIAQPEDGPISLRDYSLHMRMFAFLKSRYPKVPLSLHAGELTLGLTPPRDLRFHIREAVELAGARRIGHGVDIAYEDGAVPLLARMARERIAVEINLTSNDVILGVKGAEHPLAIYRAAGVPVVLCTDDPGVSRGDLTQEYLRAVTEQGLSYTDLRQISRDSLTYSFLEPSVKAREQQRLEQALARFEAELPAVMKSIPLKK